MEVIVSMESAGVSLDTKENFVKKRNVSMIVQDMVSVRIISVFVLMDILERIAHYMNVLIIVLKMDRVIVKQESAHVTLDSLVKIALRNIALEIVQEKAYVIIQQENANVKITMKKKTARIKNVPKIALVTVYVPKKENANVGTILLD
jgi:hypothetical protein